MRAAMRDRLHEAAPIVATAGHQNCGVSRATKRDISRDAAPFDRPAAASRAESARIVRI
ncbi:hypothetical protein F511_46533 [Dorcoceras hygrometricum]|uniref:Uncharacterized protein n=1 Tax=Dorcoceras hygrometricum TaxID=472368 RepID=A0A2Z6ZTD1_9LAMI|nr:hypothetical protein F511_46533 [Dorcoceras hygrometricum]